MLLYSWEYWCLFAIFVYLKPIDIISLVLKSTYCTVGIQHLKYVQCIWSVQNKNSAFVNFYILSIFKKHLLIYLNIDGLSLFVLNMLNTGITNRKLQKSSFRQYREKISCCSLCMLRSYVKMYAKVLILWLSRKITLFFLQRNGRVCFDTGCPNKHGKFCSITIIYFLKK